MNPNEKLAADIARAVSDSEFWLKEGPALCLRNSEWQAIIDALRKPQPEAGTFTTEVVDVDKLLDNRPGTAGDVKRIVRDAARYQRLRKNWIDCDELNLHGRTAVIDARVDEVLSK